MVHKTPTSERIKHLLLEVQRLNAAISAIKEQDETENTNEMQETLIEMRKAAEAEAAALQSSGQARLEDLSVFKVKKVTKKGNKKAKEREYWYSAWSIGGKTKNRYFGSCDKMSYEEAFECAKKTKAKELGIT